ncbi:CcdB family protein [Algiphilus sp. NNCM1]|uniref:CcdB family protein n=1 Tax=Algiphilus sp. TaxID=1872431 RepID=UPI001CA703CB|nr:CcdB family protein [Algiphilus sp.]MBY8967081.1 CcdB family protein [Algiphilus acroporae]MCI5102261.1 CcdB family protein [Algiphilus sp.]
MAQFDYYPNPNPQTSAWAPYIVDLQHEMLSSLSTRVMAPLVVSEPFGEPTMQRLNPVLTIEGQEYFLSTAEMASVPVKELSSCCGNLSEHRGELLAAVDLLFTAV